MNYNCTDLEKYGHAKFKDCEGSQKGLIFNKFLALNDIPSAFYFVLLSILKMVGYNCLDRHPFYFTF